MTVSTTTNFQMTTTQLIQRAFKRLGVAQEGEALTPAMYEDGLEEMNLLITEWNAHPRLWIKEEGTLALVGDTPSYAITPRALRVQDCRYRNLTSLIEVPMTEMSRQEYWDQPNKTTSPSVPVNFYYDPQVETGTLYLWPCPSTTTATQFDIRYDYIRLMAIMDATNNTLDMPFQWQQPLIWNLANNLETQYPVNDPRLAMKVTQRAAETYGALMQWDNEPAALFMQPDYLGLSRRRA